MFNISKSNDAFAILKKLQSASGTYPPSSTDQFSRLEETEGFGTNPGNLRMFSYMPSPVPENSALIVVLHGCGQTATGYDHGAGWSTLADRYGFTLLAPQQQRTNNPNAVSTGFSPKTRSGIEGRPRRSTKWSKRWCAKSELILAACSSLDYRLAEQ